MDITHTKKKKEKGNLNNFKVRPFYRYNDFTSVCSRGT